MSAITREQLQILQHSLGVDQHGRGPQYRNYYVASEGRHSWAELLELTAAGLMTRHPGSVLTGGADCFLVTDDGKRCVATQSPPPPKLTRSQQRYEDFLDADCGLTFGEWLKSRAGSRA